MKSTPKLAPVFIALALTFLPLWGAEALAESSFFNSRGCSGCHSPATATCNGCHGHGAHSSSAKSSINVAGTTNKTSYAPGETVTVTITGGYRTGWVRAVLYDQNKVELARSAGNASGMGGSATLPATLSAKAPTAAGSYTWKVGWYGHENDESGAAFGTGWTPDPGNPEHGAEIVNLRAFTVAAAPPPGPTTDTTAPTVTAFRLPATATSLTVPVTSFTASDNTAVTSYLVTTSATPPTASASGWTATPPTSVTATAAGAVTFYGWVKDAAGNVSSPGSASVTITLPDTAPPTISSFKLPATATSLTIPVTSLTATDNVAVTGYLINTSSTPPAATATGWTAASPTSVTASGGGSKAFYAWAKDAAGNVSNPASATVAISLPDTKPPTVTGFKMPATATSLTVPVTTLTATDDTGVTGYLVTESATSPPAGASGWTASAPASVTASAAGSKTFYAWAKDASGNISASATAPVTITVSTTTPSITISTLPDGSYTNNPTLNLSGKIVGEGEIKAVTVNDKPVTVLPDKSFTTAVTLNPGANIITVVMVDNADNKKTDKRTIYFDPVAPLLTISSPPDNSETVKSFITVEGTVDETSTVTVAVNTGSPQTATLEGNKFTATINLAAGINTIDISATDLARNTSKAKRTVTYSTTKFTLAVTSPSQDITTRHSVINLVGVVHNSSKDLRVKIQMNGKTFTPRVKDGVFRQELRFTEPKLYPVKVTATDPSGNSSTVVRNIIYQPQKKKTDDRERDRNERDRNGDDDNDDD